MNDWFTFDEIGYNGLYLELSKQTPEVKFRPGLERDNCCYSQTKKEEEEEGKKKKKKTDENYNEYSWRQI